MTPCPYQNRYILGYKIMGLFLGCITLPHCGPIYLDYLPHYLLVKITILRSKFVTMCWWNTSGLYWDWPTSPTYWSKLHACHRLVDCVALWSDLSGLLYPFITYWSKNYHLRSHLTMYRSNAYLDYTGVILFKTCCSTCPYCDQTCLCGHNFLFTVSW